MSGHQRRGLLLTLFGPCLVFALLPFAHGTSDSGMVAHLNRMYIHVLDERYVPSFSAVATGREDGAAQLVHYGESGIVLEFSRDMFEDQIRAAIEAHFQQSVATPGW